MDFFKIIWDLFCDAAIDTLKLIPLLFLAYLIMEYLENKAGEKTAGFLRKTGHTGPLIGSVLGVLPQCGFSAAASNFYAGGLISTGTLIAVFLSTSDEMLPIFLSSGIPVLTIVQILSVKVVIGLTAGYIIDFLLSRDNKPKHYDIHDLCEHEHCHCEKGSIWLSAIIHTLKVAAFILGISFLLNGITELIGLDKIITGIASYPIISIAIASLVGLIPNCASSVAITQLYLQGVLNLGCMFAGLLSCAGVGLIVLFRANKNMRDNLFIVFLLYLTSFISGLLIYFVV